VLKNWIDRGELSAVRLGQRRVRIRRSELDRFIAAGDTAHASSDEESAPPGYTGPSTADVRARFGAAMAEASAALEHDRQDLASALNSLADAARSLAQALTKHPPR
jgi:hypothetical protein